MNHQMSTDLEQNGSMTISILMNFFAACQKSLNSDTEKAKFTNKSVPVD